MINPDAEDALDALAMIRLFGNAQDRTQLSPDEVNSFIAILNQRDYNEVIRLLCATAEFTAVVLRDLSTILNDHVGGLDVPYSPDLILNDVIETLVDANANGSP